MSKKVLVVLNSAEIGKLLKSDEVQEMLKKTAQEKSGGWETDVKVLNSRAVASIYTSDYDQAGEELDSHRIVGGL